MNNIKYILVNDGAAEPRSKAALPRFKVQGSKFSDQGQSDQRVDDKGQSSKFSDLKVQSDQRVDDKVQGGFAAVQWASPSSKIKVQSGFAAGQSGSEREGLIEELCRLRKQYPKAKILGVSELGERCVQPSERMNQLRRELSERL